MENRLKELIEDLISEIEQEDLEIEEATTTSNVDGYNTPNAFKDSDGTDEDDESDDVYINHIIKATGYTKVNENRWHELRKDESSPKVKIGKGISNVNKQLSEIETFLRWYGKIKNESGIDKDQYWKRTQKNLFRIRERLNNIVTSISKL